MREKGKRRAWHRGTHARVKKQVSANIFGPIKAMDSHKFPKHQSLLNHMDLGVLRMSS